MAPKRLSLSLNQRITISIALFAIAVTVITAFVSGHDWFTQSDRLQKVESRGRITDLISQQPIPNAKVTLDLESAPLIGYTDSEGFYLLKVAIDSNTSGQIRVDAQGYETYTRYVTIYPELGTIEDIRLSQAQIAAITSTIPTESPKVTAAPISTLTPIVSPTPIVPPTTVVSPTPIIPPTTVDGKTFAIIALDIYSAGLRRTPGYVNKDLSSDIIIEINSGQTVEILGESQITDGLIWWKVSWNGYTGWIAEHTGSGKTILIFD